FAFSQGLPDSETALSCERNLAYIADIAGAVDVPVNADFACGYGESPQDVADNATRCIATGVAGLSIEDATGDPSSPLAQSIRRKHAGLGTKPEATASIADTTRRIVSFGLCASCVTTGPALIAAGCRRPCGSSAVSASGKCLPTSC